MGKKCYVVTSLLEDFDENTAEVNVIKIVESKEKAKKLLLELKDELVDRYTDCDITDYRVDEAFTKEYGYITITNKMEATTYEYNESEIN